ncbi:MAG: DM13 domain-containing protein [Salinibacter sp.]
MRATPAYNLFGTLAVIGLLLIGLGTSGVPDALVSEGSVRTALDEGSAEGTFEARAQSVAGRAVIRRGAPDGPVLSFENFRLIPTPAPHVYLSSAPDVTMDDVTNGPPIQEALNGAVWHVGVLKKGEGSQRYRLSSSVPLARAASVVIWGEKRNVPLAVAPLNGRDAGTK